jgi:Ser/Thr protein kinase RdoA (MazF antagonist)
MDKELGKPIAFGRTAEIYAWEDDRVLKLFYDWFELDNIEFEQQMNRAVHASGLPVPAPGEILQVNGRNGLVYGRVDGAPMWDVMARRPWRLFVLARQTAELHAAMHATTTKVEIPRQRARLERKIRGADSLPAPLKEGTLHSLASLPDGDQLCHGDFHPANILLTPKHPVIIDWIDASLGNPLADLARTSIIILGAAATSQVPNPLEKIVVRLFHSAYLRHYFRLRPGVEKEYHRWLPVVAAARLSENIPELKDWLVKVTIKGFSS